MGDGARRGSRDRGDADAPAVAAPRSPGQQTSKFQPATEVAIRRALFDHKKNGAGAQRLWFFYAGHGIAPAGGGPDEAPVVVPADVTDLDFYRSNPIDLGSWIREMQVCSPEYQVYFVDACRGIVVSEDVVTATKTLFFDLSKVKPGDQARQAVLFATTAGQLANEQGLHGLFGGALIDGLQGTGPALEADAETEEFVLTFGGLAAYTKRRIQLQSDEARRANKTLPTQEPAESLFRVQSSLELARFEEKPRSRRQGVRRAGGGHGGRHRRHSRLQRVEGGVGAPGGEAVAARRAGRVGAVVDRLQDRDRGTRLRELGEEGRGHRADGAARGPRPEAERPGRPPCAARACGGLESLDPLAGAGELSAPPDGAELAAGKQGQLVVRARDRYARIEVFDVDGKRVEAAWERLDKTLPVGSYRVEIALPTERPIVQSVLVTADEPEVIDVQPDPQLTQRLPASAGMIQPHDGMSEPSEAFGIATTTHLGSLLAWAASAAQFDPDGDGQKLRALGVERSAAGPGTVLRARPRRRCAGARAEPAGRTDRDAGPRHESAAGGAEAACRRSRGLRCNGTRRCHFTRASPCRPAGSTRSAFRCRSSRITCGRS